MPFGFDKLHAALRQLGADLQQRIGENRTATADAQRQAAHAITTAITTARESTRRDIDALRDKLDTLHGDIGRTSSEIAKLHAIIESWQAEAVRARAAAEETRRAIEAAAQRQPAADPAETPEPAQPAPTAAPAEDAPDTSNHETLLGLAAGIAYAELLCHRDTWAFLVERAARGEHFRLPAAVDEKDDGRIEADLSGRALLATLEALWETRLAGGPPGTRHMAERIYDRIEAALKQIEPSAPGEPAETTDARSVTRIVIDDRPAT